MNVHIVSMLDKENQSVNVNRYRLVIQNQLDLYLPMIHLLDGKKLEENGYGFVLFVNLRELEIEI